MRQLPAQTFETASAVLVIARPGQEDHGARPPVMIGRHGRVEAKHLGARADQRGAVLQAWEFGIERRPHRLPVEAARQFEAGGEGREIVVHYHVSWKSGNQTESQTPPFAIRHSLIHATPA